MEPNSSQTDSSSSAKPEAYEPLGPSSSDQGVISILVKAWKAIDALFVLVPFVAFLGIIVYGAIARRSFATFVIGLAILVLTGLLVREKLKFDRR
jgi:hypothetical protein